MDKEQLQLNKLNMLMTAIEAIKDEEDAPDFVEELKDCAWNIVRENPGIDRSEWIDQLIRQYPSEVVDAFGVNPPEVYHELTDLWEMEYTDPETGEWNSFAGWSEYFVNDLQ